MTITLEISGNRYDGFTSINVFKSIETISGSFNFSATSDNILVFPVQVGSACRVLIDNNPIITGYIENVSVSYDSGTHSLQISGRDKTCDIVDSTAVGKKEFSGPISLTQIITKSLSDNSITDISIINNAGTIAKFEDSDLFGAEVGETLFSFIEKYARKRQVLLSSNGDGNIVLNRAGSTKALVALENIVGGQTNNIKSGNISYDLTQRFNKYIMQSQLNNSALFDESGTSTDNAVTQTGEATDNKIKRTSRQLEITSNSSDSSVTLKDLATWHSNLRRARGTTYNVIVQGFYQDEAKTRLWTNNELVQVVDDFADVSATLLIQSVEYNFSLESGSTTNISLVDKDAYTLEANISAAEQRVNDKGFNLGL